MLQANQLIGTPVIAYDSGEEIGSVKEVIVHRAKKCVVGFIVERTAWFHHLRALPFSEITSFDNSAVLVRSASSVGSPEHIPGGSHLIERKPLVSSTLITGNGHEVGHIDDIYFDNQSGKISGFDVVVKLADGELSDPKFLRMEDDIHIGPDDVVLSEDVVNRLMFDVTEVGRTGAPPAAVLNERSQEVIHHPDIPDHPVAFAQPVMPAQPVVPDHSPAPEPIVAKPINPNHLNITRDGSALVIAFECTDMPDDHSIARYREQIFQILAENENCTKLSFDVKNLKVLPSSMLGMMVNLRKKVDNVEIVNPSPIGRDTLRMLKFDKYMTIRDHRL